MPMTKCLVDSFPLCVSLPALCDGAAHAFVLDSAAAGHPASRFSILGRDPVCALECHGQQARWQWRDGTVHREDTSPWEALGRLLALRPSASAVPPWPFNPAGGVVLLCAGYELARYVERLPVPPGDDSRLGDLHAWYYDAVAIVDPMTGQTIAAGHGPDGRRGAQRLEGLLSAEHGDVPVAEPPAGLRVRAECSRNAYEAAVARVLDYIGAGDVYQVNLAQRFVADDVPTAGEVYQRLRAASPAPFGALIDLGEDRHVLCDSPERFLRVSGRDVYTQPIKGTRPRGRDPAEDGRLAAELRGSEKDAAELAMIVDLLRNDLGRVCEFGSVRVVSPGTLESHPTVHHRVATVAGRLRHDASPIDLLRATFPGGSITGAPKIRAMEIIAELEPLWRRIYTGSIGYIAADGTADLNIAIRTMVIEDGRAWFHAGGGIVADSKPALEYEETLHKANAMMRSLGASTEDLSAAQALTH